MNIDDFRRLLELDDESKKNILYDTEFIKANNISESQITLIIESLSEKLKEEIVNDRDLLVEKIGFNGWRISRLCKTIDNDETKLNIIKKYKLIGSDRLEVISYCNDDTKLNIILNDGEVNNYDKQRIISLLSSKNVMAFIKDNKEFLRSIDSSPYIVIANLNEEKQADIVKQLEYMGLDLNEKRKILAMLREDVKSQIDTSNLPEEYKTAINMKRDGGSIWIKVDYDKNLEDYRGLDSLILESPQEFTSDQRKKLMELCDICPDATICNKLNNIIPFYSTASEYKDAEQWIDSLIGSLNPEYSDAQKLAIIDNAFGKKVSYAPDFDTEVSDIDDVRALWKIISKRLWGMQWNCSSRTVCIRKSRNRK